MNLRAMLLGVALVAMSAAFIPSGSAQLPVVQPCGNSAVHTYHIAGTVGATINGSFGGAGFVDAEDTCPAASSNPNDFDNDYDAAFGGGIFHASATCGPAPGPYGDSPHHAFAPGSAYTASQGTGTIAYTVGTDGEIIDPTTNTPIPCTGNNIVSDDSVTDPTDCGQGDTGISPGGPFATIGPNTATNSCDPADGYVAAFLAYGPVIGCDGTPTDSGACIDIDETRNPPVQESITTGNHFISAPTFGTIIG